MSASALPPEARAAFIADACGGDAALEEELTSLLAHAPGAGERIRGGIGGAIGAILAASAKAADSFDGHRRSNDGRAGHDEEDAADDDAPPDPRIGTTFAGRYTILGRLGEGGFGTVYRARQHDLEREVALKIAHPRTGRSQLARFEREMRVTARLQHPNCIRIYDFGRSDDDGALYLSMELVRGESLEAALRPRLSVARTVAIARQIVMALGEAHAQGIVHRDLKPDNVMLTTAFGEGEVAKVLDFGIARWLEAGAAPSLTDTGMFIGTVAYASPEQVRGERVDARSDLYSLGVVLYRMLVGATPFAGESALTMILLKATKRPPPVAQAAAIAGAEPVPRHLAALVDDLLAREPAARPRSCEEVLYRLDHAVVPRRRRPWLGVATALALALGLAVVAVTSGGAGAREIVIDDRSVAVDGDVVTWSAWREAVGATSGGGDGDAAAAGLGGWHMAAYANARSRAEGLPECYVLSACRGAPGDATFACDAGDSAGVACAGYRLPTRAELASLAPGADEAVLASDAAEACLGRAEPCFVASARADTSARAAQVFRLARTRLPQVPGRTRTLAGVLARSAASALGANAVIVGGVALHLDRDVAVTTFRDDPALDIARAAVDQPASGQRYLRYGVGIDRDIGATRGALGALRARVDKVVVHSSRGRDARAAFAELAREGLAVHFIVAPDGRVEQLLDVADSAFSAGALNSSAIAVMLVGDADFTAAQRDALASLGRLFVAILPRLSPEVALDAEGRARRDVMPDAIDFSGFIAHEQADATAAGCPGPGFDWLALREAVRSFESRR